MTTTLLTGATGTIGRHLVKRLGAPRVLARSPERARAALGVVSAFAWDAESEVPPEAMEGVDVVIHLAGESVAGRWTEAKKSRIYESRVHGTRRVVEAIRRAERRPRVLIAGSAIGIYGSRGDETLTEESRPGDDFLADVCRAWEAEAAQAQAFGVRVVNVRTGHVLASDGGLLARMLPLFRLGLGGPLGSGSQWMPWIHVEDEVGLLLHAAEHSEIEGPMNACAPDTVTNRLFARELGRVLHRPAFLRAPSRALRLAFGDLAEVILASQRVIPAVALRTGYPFRFDSLGAALKDVAARGSRGRASIEAHP